MAPAGANGHETLGGKPAAFELPPGTLSFLAASFKKQWRRYRRELKRCQKKFSARGVHESRVATRRLLSMIELLSSFIGPGRVRKMEAALKRHLDTFDDLRDTQVQLGTVAKMRQSYPAARQFHAFLRKREERFARRTRRKVKRIKTARLAKLIAAGRDELSRSQKKSAPPAANARLLRSVDVAFERTQRLREHIAPKKPASIHCTRVAFKKFRYIVETLAKYLPPADEKLLAAMHGYQTMMGEIQDAEVLFQSFARFARKKRLETADARRFREELLRRRVWLTRVYLDAADQLLEFWPRRGITGRRGVPSAVHRKKHAEAERRARAAPHPARSER
ncbi:MAG TPA: CHAD domain-containing protein [Candidatus Binatia bacterium]|nr:CHAD domain-containing protein [Candidatus Binatia bacterium]